MVIFKEWKNRTLSTMETKLKWAPHSHPFLSNRVVLRANNKSSKKSRKPNNNQKASSKRKGREKAERADHQYRMKSFSQILNTLNMMLHRLPSYPYLLSSRLSKLTTSKLRNCPTTIEPSCIIRRQLIISTLWMRDRRAPSKRVMSHMARNQDIVLNKVRKK